MPIFKIKTMTNKIIILAVLLFTVLSFNAKAQPGANDPTFNPIDIGFSNGDGANGIVYSNSIQSDGKIIIGGNFTSYNGIARNYIARLNADGSLDGTFNPGTGANSTVYTISIQNDGKIIIGGSFTFYNGTIINRIARLNADGSLDETFTVGTGASGGTVLTSSIQSDGKIIIGGSFTSYNETAINRIAQLNADGTLDGTFNSGTGANNAVRTSTIQSDGKIIIGGSFTSYNGTAINYIARLNADGSLDGTFTVGTGANASVFTIFIQSDGKIIIGGDFTSYNGTTRTRIARLNADGTLDGTFTVGTGANNTVYTSSIQNDGKVIICGYFTTYNGTARNGIARLNADGTLDGNFNVGTGVNNIVWTSSVQSDGKIIVGGGFTSYNGTSRNYIARLNADGTLDGTFNSGTGANNSVFTISIQSDGKIIIGGQFTSYNGSTINRIARLNSDGSLDAMFNQGIGANNYVETHSIQSDGKIIIGGDFTSYNGTSRNYIARLNADGTLDGTFNPGTGATNTVVTNSIQSDGKIIIGGGFTTYNGTARNRIARLNADGTLDGTFNPGTGANNPVYTTIIKSDGKIIIGGQFTSYNGTARNRIARLNANGTLDGTYNPGTGTNAEIYTTTIQSDGKIIIGGAFTSYNGTVRNGIARLNTDGTLDGTFNPGTGASGGIVLTSSIQSDGKIIIGGTFSSYNGTARNGIARLNTDGTLDVTFNPGTGATAVQAIAIQSDEKIIIGGSFTSYNGIGRNRVARLIGGVCIPTSSSQTFVECAGFLITVGTNTYTATGVYTDILIGSNGCDSTITTNLTIKQSTASSQSASACESYFWNGTTYNTSGTKTFVTTNAAGCDSIVTLNLTINNSNTGDTSATACYSYTWLGTIYTTSGNPTHIFQNVAGCDSIVTLHLTINNSNTGNTSATACDSFTWLGTTYTTSGNPTHIFQNLAGCDSIVTLHLTINNSNTGDTSATSCDSYTWFGTTYTTSGNPTHVFQNVAGCDSIVTLQMTINNSSTSSISVNTCDSYTAPDGAIYTTSGIKTAVIFNTVGCDSTITIDLTIYTVDVSVVLSEPTITANASGAIYQWVDCDNGYLPISGEINQSFTAIAIGNYAVIITQGLCSDTSECNQITTTGISSLQKEAISIYPNPVSNELIIEIKGNKEKTDYEILNSIGQIVFKSNFIEKTTVQTNNFAPGFYLVKLKNLSNGMGSGKTFEFKKIVKE